jgi:CheY-like chemotaxis protein
MPKISYLLIEDDDVDAEYIQRLLVQKDSTALIYRAEDGEEAIRMLGQLLPLPREEKLIVIVDLNMPRMNGSEFLLFARISFNLVNTPIIAVSTSQNALDIHAQRTKEVSACILKSHLTDELPTILEKLRTT